MKISCEKMCDRMINQDVVARFILASLCANDKTKEVVNAVERDGREYNIEFKINGIELDFITTVEYIYFALVKQYQEQVTKAAKKIVNERAEEVISKISFEVDRWVEHIQDKIEADNQSNFELNPEDLGGI